MIEAKAVTVNNQAAVMGEVVSGFSFSHQVFGEGFYLMHMKVQRNSGSYDTVPVMVSDRLLDANADFTGTFLSVEGQFRSHNRHEDGRNKVSLYVFAREARIVDDIIPDINQVYLDGYICREPVYRKTPLGREITELLLAVNRPYGKSDYIPCICWGRNARYAGSFKVGGHIAIWGRIQSREYMKKINDYAAEARVAYEVSVLRVETLEGGREDDK